MLFQLKKFGNLFQSKLLSKSLYTASIDGMKLRMQDLWEKNEQAWKFRLDQLGKDNWKDINGILHYQGLSYVTEIIQTELISRHHNNSWVGHFGIEKTSKLVGRKYYWPLLSHDVKDHIKGCNVYLVLKAVYHKSYGDLQSLPVPTHY